MSKAVKLDKTNFDSEIASGVTLVDFWAEWCTPCKMIEPVLDEISEEMAGKVKIGKLNTDEDPELASKYKVQSIPNMVIFKDGQEVGRVIGAQPKANIEEEIKKYI